MTMSNDEEGHIIANDDLVIENWKKIINGENFE